MTSLILLLALTQSLLQDDLSAPAAQKHPRYIPTARP